MVILKGESEIITKFERVVGSVVDPGVIRVLGTWKGVL